MSYNQEQAARIRSLVLALESQTQMTADARIGNLRLALDEVREIDRSRRFNIYLFPAIIVILFVFVGGLVAGLEIGHAKGKRLPPVEHQPTPPVEQEATP